MLGGGVRPQAPHEEALDCPAARDPPPQQPRRKDPRVVHDHEIAGAQALGQRCYGGMNKRSRLPIDVQQPRSRTLDRRPLRDELGREVEIEVPNLHPDRMLTGV